MIHEINAAVHAHPLIISFLIDAVLICAIAFVGSGLVNTGHGKDIRKISFLFAFSFFCMYVIMGIAIDVGAIDDHGSFKKNVKWILDYMMGFTMDVKVFSGIFFVFVGPQIFSYVFSGLFGCATDTIYVGKAVECFILAVLKALVVTVASALSISIFAYLNARTGWGVKTVASMLMLALMTIMVIFSWLKIYYDGVDALIKGIPIFNKMRTFFTRKMNVKPADSIACFFT